MDFLSFESRMVPGTHVTGNAIQTAPSVPKSGHTANQHDKVAAATVVAMLTGHAPNASPLYTSTCYGFATPDEVIHMAAVHYYDVTRHTMVMAPGTGGLSGIPPPAEGKLA